MDIYQHFRKDEHVFIDHVLSWKDQVERSYIPKLTHFLNPREQEIVQMLIKERDDVHVQLNGGHAKAERKRALIFPVYDQIDSSDFELALLQTSFARKFIKIKHPDVMGAFLSQGIKRNTLGDIHVSGETIQLVTTKEIAPFVITQLQGIKKTSVQFADVPFSKYIEKEEIWKETDITVSSLRLDVIIKEVYHLSRNKASQYITKGHVKVNFKKLEDVKLSIEKNDLISVRGKGRIYISDIQGKTKKGKHKLSVKTI